MSFPYLFIAPLDADLILSRSMGGSEVPGDAKLSQR